MYRHIENCGLRLNCFHDLKLKIEILHSSENFDAGAQNTVTELN